MTPASRLTFQAAIGLLLLCLPLTFLPAQTSLEEVIGDMTLPHEGKPHGVPDWMDWSDAPRYGAEAPPDHWDAAITWGQLYEWEGGNPSPNTRVQIRDLEMYYLSKTDLKWRLLQSAVRVDGAAYVEDFQGDINRPADMRLEADGSISVTAGEGYNFHFWPQSGRINYPMGDVKAVFTTVRARLVLDDPALPDDRDSARYVMGVGGDWWESLSAVWDNWTTNWDMGIGRFRFVTSQWKSFNMISLPEDSIRKYPPPFHTRSPDVPPAYLDPEASVEERVADLLGRMLPEEKYGQMTQANWKQVNPESHMKTYFLGSLLNGGGGSPSDNTPEGWAELYDRFQLQALDTRLGIPYLYGTDAVHGHNNLEGAVMFPHNIGLGCTRNDSLVEAVARITAIEVAATGVDWTFAPCIAVPRDERWGRSYEGFSEDPELVARLGAAAVRGYQGDSLSDSTAILACAKHYVGDGGTTGGTDQGNTELSEQELRDIHLSPYPPAIEAGVGSIMASYNSWNGQKVHGSKYLLTDVLKKELGFEGFIVSDWAAIDQLPGDYNADIVQSINAGVDMVMVPNEYQNFIRGLKKGVLEGQIPWERIDDANTRILRQKFRMGLFEAPMARRSMFELVGSPGHRQVARQAVRESLVLLKNRHRILPLDPEEGHIHVAGRHADNLGYQLGGWSISWQGGSGEVTEGTTVLEAISQVATGQVSYDAQGYSPEAEGAGVAVVVVGEEPYAEGAGDRNDLSIYEDDLEVLRSLHEQGLKVVTVLFSGRPMILDGLWHYSDAVVAAWLPGTEGQGITDVLFGDHEPSGKLSFSWPASMEHIPLNLGSDPYAPLFPYGFGIDTFALPSPSAPPRALSAATHSTEAHVELSFDKDMLAPAQGLLWLRVNGALAEISQIDLKEGDPSTLLISMATAPEAGDQLHVGSDAGLEAADGSMAEAFELKVYNSIIQLQTIAGRIQAEDYHRMWGVDTEACSDAGGGQNVGWIDNGDWMEYRVEVAEAGLYLAQYRVAANTANGIIRMRIREGEHWRTLHMLEFNATGGWQNWTTVSDTLSLPAGVQRLQLEARRGGFNLNWMDFTLSTGLEGEEAAAGPALRAWPNPATEVLYLDAAGLVPVHYQLLSMEGRVLREGEFQGSSQVGLEGCPPGLYILQVQAAGEQKPRHLKVLIGEH